MTWCFRNKLLLGKLKDTKNGVKSIFLKNMVSQKLKFGKKKVFFWENNPFLGIIFWEKTVRKKTGGALCVRKVTREDVKRRI